MKFNRLFTASLLAALAFGTYACGGDDGDTCTTGEYAACKSDTVASVCQDNAWVDVNCANSGKVCDKGKTNKCVNGGGGGDACEGKLKEGGSVNDTCDAACYKSTCTNSGKNALVCQQGKVAEWTCAETCQDAGYDPSKPLQVKCDKPSGTSCEGKLTTGGSVDADCDPACYTQTCINDGANALVCSKGKVAQWTCAETCKAAGYDPSKPLYVDCPSGGGGGADLPEDVKNAPTPCTKAMCSSNGNAYFCDKDKGTFYFDASKGTCDADHTCEVCDNGFAGCGITCNGGGGTELPEDVLAEQEKGACTKAICSTVDKNAYFCDKDKGTFYFDASKGTCDAENTCTVCENGFAGCGITCDEDLEDCTAESTSKCKAACNAEKTEGYYWNNTQNQKSTKSCESNQECRLNGTQINCIATDLPAECTGSVCSELDGYAYFCDLESKSFYLANSGKCTSAQPCKICTDGFGGCGTDCTEGGHDQACTETDLTTEADVGACCNSLEYLPSCDGNTLNYCRSWGKVETKDCGSTCSVDATTKKYECK